MKPLYIHPMKAKVLGEIFATWLKQLESDGCLPGEAVAEFPSSILWVRVLYAQHLDKVGRPATP